MSFTSLTPPPAYVTQSTVSDATNSIQAIPNAIHSTLLDVELIQDAVTIKAFRDDIANQMNSQRHPLTVVDLSSQIADVKIETTAQGASLLEVHIIDPFWGLFTPGQNGEAFIDAYDDGWLIPIYINFPPGTDSTWALVAANPTLDFSQANVTLTFEDKIANDLRQKWGPKQSNTGETLGAFILRVVHDADPQIHVVELLSPNDPNYTAPAAPSSATNPVSPARANPNKGVGAAGTVPANLKTGNNPRGVAIVNPPNQMSSTNVIQQETARANQYAHSSNNIFLSNPLTTPL